MKAASRHTKRHFWAHFDWGWRPVGLSQSTQAVHPLRRLAAFISQTKRYFNFQTTNEKSGFLVSEGNRTRSAYHPLNFYEIWERESAPAMLKLDLAIRKPEAFGDLSVIGLSANILITERRTETGDRQARTGHGRERLPAGYLFCLGQVR